MTTPPRSITQLMDAYLTGSGGGRPKVVDRASVEGSLSLLRSGLEGYGYQYLTAAQAVRWDPEDAEDTEGAREFCDIFGARVLVKYLDEFLGYFMIRKVLFKADEVAEVIEDVRGFVAWLAVERELPPTIARKALGRLARAADEVPAAERLSDLLYKIATAGRDEIAPRVQPEYDETIDDFLVIERVAPGRIWFLDGVGPIKVPEAASRLARPGWTINLVLGRAGQRWDVLEVGNVYPETLA